MKPSKKQVKPAATKNQENEKNVQGIGTFFKAVPKPLAVDKNVVAEKQCDGPKKFYVDILKDKLRRVRDVQDENGSLTDGAVIIEQENENIVRTSENQVESHCREPKTTTECAGCIQKSTEIDEWQQKYYHEVERRKELKKVYINLNIQFSELYCKHKDLLKASTNHRSADDADAATSSEEIFTPTEVKFLQCMELDKKNDCTFIHNCIKFAYKCDRSVLVSKTLKGTAEKIEISPEGEETHHAAKSPLTPQKVERIRGLFVERISKCQINSVDYADRMKESYVNKLFAAGIKNLSKKFK